MTQFIIFTGGKTTIDTTAWKLYQVFKKDRGEFYVDDAGDERDYRSTIYVGRITIPIWMD